MGRAVDSQTQVSGSNPAAANFFSGFFFFKIFLSSAFAEGGAFFLSKIPPHFLKNHYINYRYDRCYAEDLPPPHYWQTNSNDGSLGMQIQACVSLTQRNDRVKQMVGYHAQESPVLPGQDAQVDGEVDCVGEEDGHGDHGS